MIKNEVVNGVFSKKYNDKYDFGMRSAIFVVRETLYLYLSAR